MNKYSQKKLSIKVTNVNIRFLSPFVLLFYSVLIFFACLPFLPVEIQYPMSLNALLFWLLCFVGFLVGVRTGAGRRFSMPILEHRFNPKKLHDMVRVIVWVGALGVLLLIVDRYFIRGVSLGADVFQNREALEGNQASGLSAVAAFASSVGLLSLIMIWIAELSKVIVSKWMKVGASLNVLVAVYLSTQLGSRSLLLVVMLIHLFAWFFVFRAKGMRVEARHKALVLLSLFGLAVLSALIMISRVELMGFSMQDSVFNSAYAYTMLPSDYIFSLLYSNEKYQDILAGLFSLVQYVFHGIYEFGLLFSDFQGEHEFGSRTLWLPLKVISVVSNGWITIGFFENHGERLGVFTTFVGPVYVDYGYFSPIALLVYGFFLGLTFRFFCFGRLEWLPAVVLVASGVILWPIVNIFYSASGTYLLVAALVIGYFGRLAVELGKK